MADHAVAAHGGEHHYFRAGQFLSRAFETERITDAVARNAGGEAALLGSIDGRGDVDAEPEIGVLHRSDEILGGDAIIEYRRHSCGTGETADDGLKIRRRVSV